MEQSNIVKQSDVNEIRELLSPTPQKEAKEPVDDAPSEEEVQETRETSNKARGQDVEPDVETEEEENEDTGSNDSSDDDVSDDDDDSSDGEPKSVPNSEMPKSINDWADAVEVEVSDLYNMEISMPDGSDAVTLSELKNDYIENRRSDGRLETQLQEQSNVIEQLQIQNKQSLNLSNEKIGIIGQLNELERQYNTTDWQTLEQQDPGKAGLLYQKFNQAQTKLQNSLQQMDQNEQAQKQSSFNDNMKQAFNDTLTAIPEWSDTKVRSEDSKAIEKMLQDEGLAKEVIEGVNDPTTIKLLRELLVYRNQDKAGKKLFKKVRKTPKVFKGSSRAKAKPKTKQDKLVKTAKQNPKDKTAQLNAAKSLLGFS